MSSEKEIAAEMSAENGELLDHMATKRKVAERLENDEEYKEKYIKLQEQRNGAEPIDIDELMEDNIDPQHEPDETDEYLAQMAKLVKDIQTTDEVEQNLEDYGPEDIVDDDIDSEFGNTDCSEIPLEGYIREQQAKNLGSDQEGHSLSGWSGAAPKIYIENLTIQTLNLSL